MSVIEGLPSVPLASPARLALRTATAAVHERLHHLPVFAALAAGRIDRADYAALLGRLWGFHDPMEAAVARAGPPGVTPVQWRRAHLLRSDLTALGLSDVAVDRLPLHDAPTERWSPAHAMGALYVIEGSTLGGRILARKLDHLLAGGTAGREFLLAGTGDDHVRWRDLGLALDGCGASPGPRAEMIAAADDTFRRFEAWFSQMPANSRVHHTT